MKKKDMTFDEAFAEATSSDNEKVLEANAEHTSLESETPDLEDETSTNEESEHETPDSDVETTEDTKAEEETGLPSTDSTEESEDSKESTTFDRYKALYELERQRREQAEQKHRMTEGRLIAATRNHSGLNSSDKKGTDEPVTESKALAEFREEYPELVGPIEEMLKMQLAARTKQLESSLHTQIDPIIQKVEDTEKMSHVQQIAAVHPDWEVIVNGGDLDLWQASLDPISRAGVEYVRSNGSAAEVNELLSRYKADRKMTNNTPATKAPTKPTKSNKKADEDDLVARLKAALAVASSKSSAPVAKKEVDPDDFDAAFEEAERALM